ncbi:hypothetical protein [Streptomyces prasinus]|uniref:hypothetical protein n=1 Tax=Streptomyces prasinus TaxID=67345 RepID=UPI003AFA0925
MLGQPGGQAAHGRVVGPPHRGAHDGGRQAAGERGAHPGDIAYQAALHLADILIRARR